MTKRATDGHDWHEHTLDHRECRSCALHWLRVHRRDGGFRTFWIQGTAVAHDKRTPACTPAALPRSLLVAED